MSSFWRGTIGSVGSGLGGHLRDLRLLRRVRDRMDREYAQPLNVESLARGVNMSAGHLSRQFKSVDREQTADVTAGLPSCMEKQVTTPIRNREAAAADLHLA